MITKDSKYIIHYTLLFLTGYFLFQGRRSCWSAADVPGCRRVAPGGRVRVEAWLLRSGPAAPPLRQGLCQLGLGP